MFKKYYSLKKILKTNSVYNIIVGERSNGKTYATLKYGIENYFQTGGQIAIIRRWQVDIRGSRASEVFSSLIANDEINKISKGKYTGIHFWGGKYYLCNYENGKAIYNDNDVIAYPFSLSDTEHNKSISYPLVDTIIFDEFITRQVYLQDEFILFMNTISTIVRDRANVKIFMLGNTVNKTSPYFTEMGIRDITKQKQGTIDIYKYGDSKLKVAIEYCESDKNSKESNFYFAFNNPKLDMITTGVWELDIYPHCPYKFKEKDIILNFFIDYNDMIFHCKIVNIYDILFIYIHNKTTTIKEESDIVYSLSSSPKVNHFKSVYSKGTKFQNLISMLFKQGKVFYQDNEVGDWVANYLKECKGVY